MFHVCLGYEIGEVHVYVCVCMCGFGGEGGQRLTW